MKVGFIGAGVMAEAMVKGMLEGNIVHSSDVVASDVLEARREYMKSAYGIQGTEDNLKALEGSEIVVLAVKPQQMAGVLNGLKGKLDKDQLFLSIAAGIRLQTLRDGLSHDILVRAMPNTPARIGKGVTMWTATPKLDEQGRDRAASVLKALGEEIYTEEEKHLDMATALSGGGPAYVATIMEALIDAGVHMGLARDVAQKLVIETLIGTGMLVKETGEHPAVLKNQVTSPGGTTAEGLLVLENGGIRGLLTTAVLAAYQKSQGLGK